MNILHSIKRVTKRIAKKFHPSVVMLVMFIGYNLLAPSAAMSDSHVEYPKEGERTVQEQKEKKKKQIKKKRKNKKNKLKKNKKKRKIKAPLAKDAKKKKNKKRKKNKNKKLQQRKKDRMNRISRLPQAEDAGPIVVKTYNARTTYYASEKWQTSGNPFISASGVHVHWGMVAANCHPFGTKLRLPDVYGDKIFTVWDRHSTRFGCNTVVDVWTDYSPGQNPRTVYNTRVEIVKEF